MGIAAPAAHPLAFVGPGARGDDGKAIALDVKKGDRVSLYMQMIPQLPIACA